MRKTCPHEGKVGCTGTFETTNFQKVFCSRRCKDAGKTSARLNPAMPVLVKEETDEQLIAALQSRGFTVSKERLPEVTRVIDTSGFKGKTAKIGVVSDTHLGSKWQQLTLLRRFIKFAEEEQGVDFFVHCGDFVDGSTRMHRDAVYNNFVHGFDAQRDYAVDVYPESKVPTYVIAGNHDYSFINGDGGDIVAAICEKRPELQYLGPIGAYLNVGPISIYLHHPFDGGAKTLSWKLQCWIEQVAPERKPHMVLKGNYHKAVHLPAYRNVEGFLVPSFQSQTPFEKGKSIHSTVGGLILTVTYGDDGIRRLGTEWCIERVPLEDDYPH
jgi:hypothetical protein